MTLEALEFQLSTLILHVEDEEMLEQCKQWYLRLGLKHSPPDNPGESVWFDTGQGTLLGIHTGETEGQRAGATLYFNVRDVDEVYRRLRAAGFVFDGPPRTKEWGGRVAYLKDPKGNGIGLVTPKA